MEKITIEYTPSRFFKYRCLPEFHGNYGTIEETWDMQNQALKYTFTTDYIFRSFNTRVNLEDHKILFLDLIELAKQLDYAPEDKHVIMFPIQLSYFESLWELYRPSTPFDVSDTVIVSAAPQRIVSSSLSFLSMDSLVTALIAMTIFVLASLLVLHWTLFSGREPTVRKILKGLVNNVWDNASLLCYEGIAIISPEMTPRLIASTWLVGVTFILFFLGCFLKTEFSIETYQTIESLSDLINSNVKPLIIERSIAHENIRILANTDPVVKKWSAEIESDEDNFCTMLELLDLDGYESVISGKRALIISKTYLTWLLGELLSQERQTKYEIAERGGLYVSEGIHTDYLHILFNKSFITRMPEIVEMGAMSVYPIFESQPYHYLDFESIFPIDYITWKKPIESVTDLNITSLTSPFYLLLILLMFTATVVALEIILLGLFPKDATRLNRRTVRRGKRVIWNRQIL